MTRVIVTEAKNGNLSATTGKHWIHSAYNPRREAEKFLEPQLNSFCKNGVVVIIGAGLGYLDNYLSSKRSDIKIIACHLIPNLYDNRISHNRAVLRWSPAQDIEKFFFSVINELDIPTVRLIEWPASIQAAPDMARRVLNNFASVLRRYAGNITTTAAFGRSWLRNTLRNYLEFDGLAVPPRLKGITVIAASGPSLELHLQSLKQHRNQYHLWALPSSLPALKRAGLKPDMVFSTDPGHWARIHGRHFPRGIPVVMPLAACPLPCQSGNPILLAQDSIGEKSLLNGDGWPTVKVPQTGSVVITAVETWRRICEGPLVLAGLDLCWFDLRSHVRPHGFDAWFADLACRTNPTMTTLWKIADKAAPKRHGAFRMGFSLTTYADWFNSTRFDAPIYRLRTQEQLPYPNRFEGIQETDESIFEKHKEICYEVHAVYPVSISQQDRKKKVLRLLKKWCRLAAEPESAMGADFELLYTLDPGSILDRIRGGTAQNWRKHQFGAKEILQGLLRSYER